MQVVMGNKESTLPGLIFPNSYFLLSFYKQYTALQESHDYQSSFLARAQMLINVKSITQ